MPLDFTSVEQSRGIAQRRLPIGAGGLFAQRLQSSATPQLPQSLEQIPQEQRLLTPEQIRSGQIQQAKEAGQEEVARALELQQRMADSSWYGDTLANFGFQRDSFDLDKQISRAVMSNNIDEIDRLSGIKKRVDQIRSEAQKDDTSRFLGTMASVAGPMVESIKDSLGYGLAGGAAGAAFGVGVGAVPGFFKGIAVGQFANWSQQGAGSLYMQLRDQGINHEVARRVSMGGGLVYGAIEQIAGLAGKLTPSLTGMLRNYMTRKLTETVLRAGGIYGANVIGETTEEALQEGVMASAYNVAAGLQEGIAEDGSELERLASGEVMGRMLEAAKESVLPIMVLGGAGGAIDLQRARSSNARVKDLESQYKKLVPDASEQTFEQLYTQAANERANTQVPFGQDKPNTIDLYTNRLRAQMTEINTQQARQREQEALKAKEEITTRQAPYKAAFDGLIDDTTTPSPDVISRLEAAALDAGIGPETNSDGSVKRPAWRVAAEQVYGSDETVVDNVKSRVIVEAADLYNQRLDERARSINASKAEEIKRNKSLQRIVRDEIVKEYNDNMGGGIITEKELTSQLRKPLTSEQIMAQLQEKYGLEEGAVPPVIPEARPTTEVPSAVQEREAAQVPVGQRAQAGTEVDQKVREQGAPVQAQEVAAARFALPKELAKSAPRYGMASLQFANDYDKTAYILARDAVKPSKSAEKFRAALTAQGLDVNQAIEHGQRVLQQIKRQMPGAAPNKPQTINVQATPFPQRPIRPEEPPEAGAAPAPTPTPPTPPAPVRVARLEPQPDGTEAEVQYQKTTTKTGREAFRKVNPETGVMTGPPFTSGRRFDELKRLEQGVQPPAPPPAREVPPMTPVEAGAIAQGLQEAETARIRAEQEGVQPVTPAVPLRQELAELNRREQPLIQAQIEGRDLTDEQLQELDDIQARKAELLGEARATRETSAALEGATATARQEIRAAEGPAQAPKEAIDDKIKAIVVSQAVSGRPLAEVTMQDWPYLWPKELKDLYKKEFDKARAKEKSKSEAQAIEDVRLGSEPSLDDKVDINSESDVKVRLAQIAAFGRDRLTSSEQAEAARMRGRNLMARHLRAVRSKQQIAEPEVLPPEAEAQVPAVPQESEFDRLARQQRETALAQRQGAVAQVGRKLQDEEIIKRLQNPDAEIADLLPSQERPEIREIKPLVDATKISLRRLEPLLRKAGYTVERGTRRITGLPTRSAKRAAQEGRRLEAAGAGQAVEGVTEETPETLAEKFDDVKAAIALTMQRQTGGASATQIRRLEGELEGVTLNGKPITRATPEELYNAALESAAALGQEIGPEIAQAARNLGVEPRAALPQAPAQLPAPEVQVDPAFEKFEDRVQSAIDNLSSPSTLRNLAKTAKDRGYINESGYKEVLRIQRELGSKEDTTDAFDELRSLLEGYREQGGRRFQTAPSVTQNQPATKQNVGAWGRQTAQKIAGSRWTEDRTGSDTVGHLRIGTKSIRFVIGDAGMTPEGRRAAGFVERRVDGEYTVVIDKQTGMISTPQHELGHILFDSLTDGQKSALSIALGYDISTVGGQERFVSENLESQEARDALADRILGLSIDQRSVVVRAINSVIRGINAMFGTNIAEIGRGKQISGVTAVELSEGLRDFSLILQDQSIPSIESSTFVERENARGKEKELSWAQTLRENNIEVQPDRRYQSTSEPIESMPYTQFESEFRDGKEWKKAAGKAFIKFHRARERKSDTLIDSYDKWIETGGLKQILEASSMEQALRSNWAGRTPEKRGTWSFMSAAGRAVKAYHGQFGSNIRTLSRIISKEQGDYVERNIKTEEAQTFRVRADEFIALEAAGVDRFDTERQRQDGINKSRKMIERIKYAPRVTTNANGLFAEEVELESSEYYQLLRYMLNDTSLRGLTSGVTITDGDRPYPIKIRKMADKKEELARLKAWAQSEIAANPDFAAMSRAQDKIADMMFPEINAIYKRMFPEKDWPTKDGLKKEEFYTAIHRDVLPNSSSKNRNRLVMLLRDMGSIKQREAYSKNPMLLRDGIDELYGSINRSAGFIANAEFTNNYRNLLATSTMRVENGEIVEDREPTSYGKEIIRVQGRQFFDNLLESIDQVEGTAYNINSLEDKAINKMMRWIARGALSGPTTVAMQPLAMFIPLVNYNSSTVFAGYNSWSKGVTKDFLLNMARNDRAGGAILHRLAHSNPLEEAVRDQPVGRVGKLTRGIDKISQIGFIPMQWMDKVTVYAQGRVAWESVQQEMPQATEAEKQREAVKRWNDLLQYQMVGDPSMKTIAHNRGGGYSVLNMFRTTINAQYLKLSEAYLKAKQSGNDQDVRDFAYRVAGIAVSMGLYVTLIRMGADEARAFFTDLFGDDEDKRRLEERREYEKNNRLMVAMREVINAIAQQLPITNIGSAVSDYLTEVILLDRRDRERYLSQVAASRVHPYASVFASGAKTVEAYNRLADAKEAYAENPTENNKRRIESAQRNLYKSALDFSRYTPASTPIPIWSNFLSIDKALFNVE